GDSGMTLTGTGIVIGTPQYMSPEQALGKRGDQLDGRSDIYSLGVVMYQMLAGELPFKTDTTMQLLLAHINTPPRPLLEAKPGLNIPPALARVVMKCLEKDPNLRPQTGEALIQELTAAETGLAESGSRESEVGATMIAAPVAKPKGAETYAGQAAQAMPTIAGTSSTAMAAATPPSLEAPPMMDVPQAGTRKPRWIVGIITALIVIALGGGAVWGGFHFGYFKIHPPAAPAQSPAQNAAQASQPAAAPPPVTPSSTAVGQGAAAESTQPNQPAQPTQVTASSAPNVESKPDAVKTSAVKNLATKSGNSTAKTHPAQQVHEAAATPQPGTSGRAGARREVAAAAPAPFNPSLATVVVTTAPGAQIYIDGKTAGTAGPSGQLTVQNLAAGVHSLRATLSGFNDIDSNFNLPPGGTGFLNAKWGASQATLAPSAANQNGSQAASNAQPASSIAASFPVEYLHRLGSSRGLLVIEGRTVRYQPSNGKDGFTSSLAGASWGAGSGQVFHVRFADGRTYRFRAPNSEKILATLRSAATGP
ncbi:MAG: protein kinase domain-containing protein, partial [Terriglobia bacterium]